MSLSGSELEQLRALASLREHRFRSRIPLIGPLIARFRELWNYEPELIEIRSRLINCEATLRALETRLADHDGWLIAQDREQSAAIGDLNEVTLRLIRALRRLDEVERRLNALEVSRENPGA